MSREKDYHVISPDKIDWSEPSLGSLLQDSTGWQLDRRNNFAVQEVSVTRDRGTDACKLGSLVWESEVEMVVATDAPLPLGERVRVDKSIGNRFQPVWAVVIKRQMEQRAANAASITHLQWLRPELAPELRM